jgi:tRNA-specific 2-thiouridylase
MVEPMKEKIVIAMSGGVDSSVAAALLLEQGYDVVGITMHLSDAPEVDVETQGTCCAPDDARDARRVAAHLGIPHYVNNYKSAFKKAVIDRFVSDYQSGLTPSPCVHCNDVLKFKLLLNRAMAIGCDKLATGHYAQIQEEDGVYYLHRGALAAKDQSYFLFGANQKALSKMLFPVGSMTKEEVRAAAERFDLPVAHKPESQDLCFVPDGNYARVVEEYATPKTGEIVDEDGTVLGQHKGIHRFTVGQRRGLGLPGGTPARFVIGISAGDGQIRVGTREKLLAQGILADRCNWVSGQAPRVGQSVLARIRHRSTPVPAVIEEAGDCMRVRFLEPVSAVAPGQAAVLYNADIPERVVGGGWIRKAFPWTGEETTQGRGVA